MVSQPRSKVQSPKVKGPLVRVCCVLRDSRGWSEASECLDTVASDARIQKVRVTRDEIVARLMDGRVISVPLAWSWRLSDATPAQRAKFRLIGAGQGIHWPEVDEDISVEGLLHGIPARRPRISAVGAKPRPPAKQAPSGRMQPTRRRAARG